MVDVDSAKFLNNLTNTSTSDSQNFTFIPHKRYPLSITTGCLYKLSPINLIWGPLKCSKSNFNPVHVFLHFKSFCLVVLKLILASKLSELELFENRAHPCPLGRYTQSFVNKLVVSYKSCMKPSLTQIQGDSNLFTDFFLRKSQKCVILPVFTVFLQ